MLTLPNFLTLMRIMLLPGFIAMFWIQDPTYGAIGSFSLFLTASITDFLDGYFARSLSQSSNWGRFLDPVADKLLVCSTLFMLAAFDILKGIHLIPALIILSREILISGLREFLGSIQIQVPVSRLGKYKTALQMIALSILLLSPLSIWLLCLGQIGLWASALLSAVSGYRYCRASIHYMDSNDDSIP